jgi:hypothetical protein
VVTSAVFLPFILIAPFAQYRTMREGRSWPGWITAWMVLQFALLPGFLLLAGTDRYFWEQDYEAGQTEGSKIKAGDLLETLMTFCSARINATSASGARRGPTLGGMKHRPVRYRGLPGGLRA